MVARGQGKGNGECMFKKYRVSAGEDEDFVWIVGGDACTTL